jgi:hypothetical protein
MNDFLTVGLLTTFAGLVLAVALIVQFTKSLLKRQFVDVSVRLYAFVVSLVLTFIFAPAGSGVQGIVLTILNAVLVCMAAMGGYEAIADPLAEKQRQE